MNWGIFLWVVVGAAMILGLLIVLRGKGASKPRSERDYAGDDKSLAPPERYRKEYDIKTQYSLSSSRSTGTTPTQNRALPEKKDVSRPVTRTAASYTPSSTNDGDQLTKAVVTYAVLSSTLSGGDTGGDTGGSSSSGSEGGSSSGCE